MSYTLFGTRSGIIRADIINAKLHLEVVLDYNQSPCKIHVKKIELRDLKFDSNINDLDRIQESSSDSSGGWTSKIFKWTWDTVSTVGEYTGSAVAYTADLFGKLDSEVAEKINELLPGLTLECENYRSLILLENLGNKKNDQNKDYTSSSIGKFFLNHRGEVIDFLTCLFPSI